ncbi:MAG: NAD-dependent epimerase/dehydratase family protein [Armatimonadota bacterium]|nr:NAD-dependent epimerase/dehydratase family protein [Armatimonadota bacterium]
MRVLVAGASGFIGFHLVCRLKSDGYEVRALARQTSDTSALDKLGVEVCKADFSELKSLISPCSGIDVAFNLIGRIGGWGVSESDLRLANVTTVKNLLEACRDAGVAHFIHCSTPGVVGMSGVAPESLPYHPTGKYEQTKYEGEKVALGAQITGSIPVTIVRPDFVYGPGDLHKLKLFRAIRDGRFPLIGDGRSLLHPTYIEDVIDGMMLVARNEAAFGQIFNLAGPEPVTVDRMVRVIAQELGIPAPRMRIPVTVAKSVAMLAEAGAIMTHSEPLLTKYQVKFFTCDHASDVSKARLALGYKPKVSIERGVELTIKWYKEQKLL